VLVVISHALEFSILAIMQFIWDENKNKANIKKHKISFEEAKSVFFDINAKMIHDPDNSITEDRFIMLGLNELLKLLVVCHCYKESNDIVRIISARKATKKETLKYGERI
jgi:uncharacterized DUF497 family protein